VRASRAAASCHKVQQSRLGSYSWPSSNYTAAVGQASSPVPQRTHGVRCTAPHRTASVSERRVSSHGHGTSTNPVVCSLHLMPLRVACMKLVMPCIPKRTRRGPPVGGLARGASTRQFARDPSLVNPVPSARLISFEPWPTAWPKQRLQSPLPGNSSSATKRPGESWV